jgi:integrase
MSPRPRYFFQRGNVWYLRLQPPGAKAIEKSLGTSDLSLAEIAASDDIKRYKEAMYARRLTRLQETQTEEHDDTFAAYKPGLHALPGGGHLLVTDDRITEIDAAGAIVSQRARYGRGFHLMGPKLSPKREFTLLDDAYAGIKPNLPTARHADDEIIEAYLRHIGANRRAERECRQTWHDYRAIVGKPLATATRADGRKLAEYYLTKRFGEGKALKSTSAIRKLAWLTAAVNFAISEGTLKFNPFLSVVPKRDDKTRRLPLSDDDMTLVRKSLGKLSTSDQLLIRLLATTGMRRSEAFQITGEQCEGGVRFVIVGEKTAQSMRRVPLPESLLTDLPTKITAPLFGPNTDMNIDRTGKRLLRWLRDAGIQGHDKTIHSFRHRAQDKLRAAGCPLDIREEILGHENVTVGKSYGLGHPVPVLKEWINTIGF